jgi:hypothetical protein
MADNKHFTAEIAERFAFGAGISERLDKEKGIVRDVVLFAPKIEDGVFVSESGRMYAPEFIGNAAPALEGALSFPKHPARNNGGWEERDVREALGRIRRVRVDGNKIIGDFHVRKAKRDDVFDLIEEAWDTIGFSLFGDGIGYRDAKGRKVLTGFDPDVKRKPTADLVDCGAATTNVFESAPRELKQTSEEKVMEKQEVVQITDADKDKLKAEVMESLKPQLDRVAALESENARLNREGIVRQKLAESALPEKYVTNGLREQLMTCDEAKITDFIKEHKEAVANSIPVVKDMGAGSGAGEKKEMTKSIVEVAGHRGLKEVVREVAGGQGFGRDRDKDQAFVKKWNAEIAESLTDIKNTDPQIKKLRAKLVEQFSGTGLRNLFAECYGILPTTEADIRDTIRETAVDSTGFAVVTSGLLGMSMIEAYQLVAAQSVAEQLTTPYRTSKATEQIAGLTAPSGSAAVSEGAAYPDVAIDDKYVTLQQITKRGGAVKITREAVLYDMTGQLLMRANRIAEKEAYEEEKAGVHGIVDAANFRCWYPSGVMTTLWDETNMVGANALADYTDLEGAALKLLAQLDENGDRIENAENPFEILVPQALMFTARKIVGGDLNETNPAAANNIRGPNPWAATRVYVSKHLDSLSPTTWYMSGAGGFKRQYLKKITIPFEVVQIPAAEVNAVTQDIIGGVRVAWATKVQAIDRKYVIKSISAALS